MSARRLALARVLLVVLFLFPCPPGPSLAAQRGPEVPVYVGSMACKQCHPDEYQSFMAYAKKSRSFHSVERMKKGLTQEELRQCYSCHTTGYGRPGGFVSPEETPQLKNAGCEVCHGPGSVHVKTGDPKDIKAKLTMNDCKSCHTSERIRAFRFRPLIHGGAH